MHQDIPEPTIILSMNAQQDPAAHPVGPTHALWPLLARRPLPRIHVISDVHLEFGPYELPADLDFDILVASGDIGPVEDAVRWLAKCGKPVVYVMGNHEYYDREFDEVLPAARAAARGTRVHVLERNAVTIQGVRFLGTTLWTSFGDWHPGLVDQAYRQMNDYELIRATRWFESSRNLAWYRRQCRAAHLALPEDDPALAADAKFHPAIAYQEHLRSVTWLNRMLDRPFDGPTVVVTHHSPPSDRWRPSASPPRTSSPRTGTGRRSATICGGWPRTRARWTRCSPATATTSTSGRTATCTRGST
jgi:hypothetical protein